MNNRDSSNNSCFYCTHEKGDLDRPCGGMWFYDCSKCETTACVCCYDRINKLCYGCEENEN